MNIKPNLLKSVVSVLAGIIVAFIIGGFVRCGFSICYGTVFIPLIITIIIVYVLWSSFQK